MKIIFFILLSLTLYAQTIDGVAILVKDQPITLFDIESAMQEHKIPQEQAIDLLVRKKLEAAEIKTRHIMASKQEIFEDIQRMAEQNKMSVIQLYSAIQSSQGLSERELKKKIKEKILNQKLYNAIAFSHLEQPTDREIEEFYNLHKEKFTQPSSFEVLIYHSTDRTHLQEKIDNPMFYAPDVQSEAQSFDPNNMNPQLAQLLNKTPINSFTPVFPAPQGGFMSFYLKDKGQSAAPDLEKIRPQVSNAIMGQKRESILKDYFDRQKLNADIKTIRLPRN